MRRSLLMLARRTLASGVTMAVAGVLLTAGGGPIRAETLGGEQLAKTSRTANLLPGADALPEVWAETWIVADAATGEILAHKGAHVQRAPASTLKTLTALAVLPRTSPDDVYVATKRAARIYGARVGLRPGKSYTLDELWYAVFLPSANDAAIAVAEANGGVRRTVRQMNELADQLQANDTVARNNSGLDAPGQLSSSYDLALIARAGLKRPDFARYASTVKAQFPDMRGKGTHTIYTTNRLLASDYKGVIGVKTGFTSQAGRTYIGAARRGDTTLIVVLMGIHESSETAARKLLTWGFANDDRVQPVGMLVDPLPAQSDTALTTPSSEATMPASPAPAATPDTLKAPGAGGGDSENPLATGSVAPSTPRTLSDALRWGAMAALLAIVVGLVLVAVVRRRRPARD